MITKREIKIEVKLGTFKGENEPDAALLGHVQRAMDQVKYHRGAKKR